MFLLIPFTEKKGNQIIDIYECNKLLSHPFSVPIAIIIIIHLHQLCILRFAEII
jgi:hypothetical protein